jgi:hypothetical protein
MKFLIIQVPRCYLNSLNTTLEAIRTLQRVLGILRYQPVTPALTDYAIGVIPVAQNPQAADEPNKKLGQQSNCCPNRKVPPKP